MKEESKLVASDAEPKKFHDVAKPGKTPAASTSRPVIVSNRSMVKDPTLKAEDEEEKNSPLTKSEAKIIAPPSGSDIEKPETESEESEPNVEESTLTEPEETTKEQVEETAKPVVEDDDQVDAKRADEEKATELSEAEKAEQARIEKLVETGQYAVPVGHIRRNKRLRTVFVVILLTILLAFVAADLLIDAGIIETDIQPIVDLIEN